MVIDSEKDDGVDKEIEEAAVKKSKKKTVKSSAKNAPEPEVKAGSNRASSILLALTVAIPAAGIVAYLAMPERLVQMYSSDNGRSSSDNVQFQAPYNPSAPASLSMADARGHRAETPEWVMQRRAEFEKQRADSYAARKPQLEQPQWVKDRQAQMEARRLELEKLNADNYAASRLMPEPPQWVKERQMLMEQERAKYQQWANNQPQQYPSPVQAYPQNTGQQFYNGYPQPQNPYQYNNGPYNGYGQYNAPYGGYSYPPR